MSKIHPSAIVAPSAELGEDVEIGPFAVIGERVVIGAGTQIGPQAQVLDYSRIGARCEIHQGAVIGGIPQDKKFHGEETSTVLGDDNVIREYTTINRGTEGGGGKTILGNNNLVMSYVHIAHDCIIGNHVILGSYTGLTGHVVMNDYSATSGMVGIHHFCRVGKMAYVGGFSKVTQDVPPFVMADGNPCRYRGLNLVGLRRNTLSPGAIAGLKEAYRVLFVDKAGNLSEILEEIKQQEEYSFPEVQELVQFMAERSQNTKARYLENFRADKPKG